jgi:hypothetical protein
MFWHLYAMTGYEEIATSSAVGRRRYAETLNRPDPLPAILLVLALVGGMGARAEAGQISDLERQRLLAHLEMTGSWLIDEVQGLSPGQAAFRPAPDSWTILQVVEHLVMVGPIYWDALQKALASPPVPGASTNTDVGLLWYGIDRSPSARESAIPSEVPTGRLKYPRSGLAA